MSNEIMKSFENDRFGNMRVIERDGNPWFVAMDVCRALEINNGRMACARLDDDEKGVSLIDTLGGIQNLTIVNESGLYSLILGSRKPEAKEFKRWVTHDVLPSIRKNGAYIAGQDELSQEELFAKAIIAAQKVIEEREKRIVGLTTQVAELLPKASYCDTVLKARNPITVTQIAKDYGMSAVRFNKLLKDLKIQYRSGDCWVLCQKYANNGYTKTSTISLDDQSAVIHTYWTQKGRLFLYDVLKKNGTLPVVEK